MQEQTKKEREKERAIPDVRHKKIRIDEFSQPR